MNGRRSAALSGPVVRRAVHNEAEHGLLNFDPDDLAGASSAAVDAGDGDGDSDGSGGVADGVAVDAFDDDDFGSHACAASDVAGAGAVAPAVTEERLVAWIEGIVARDERALTALYDATAARTYGLVRCIVRHTALAEEVVEDTYFQVWRQAVRFDASRGRALTWLLAMARSRAIDMLRREARFQRGKLDLEAVSEAAGDTVPADDLLAAANGHAELHRAMMRLNAQPRQLLALAFFRGLTHEEIANQTELPLGTVKSQIRRSLVTLKQLLGDGGQQALPA